MAISLTCEFMFLFYFLFLWPKVMVLDSLSVRLGLVMVPIHLGKVWGHRSRFAIMAMCHICLYVYFHFLFVSPLIWLVSDRLGLLRFCKPSKHGRTWHSLLIAKIAICSHMLFLLFCFLFILFLFGVKKGRV